MKILTIGDKEYKLEFSFDAAMHKDCVNQMFKIVSGGYIGQQGIMGEPTETKAEMASAVFNGIGSMYSEIPHTTVTAFYAGLLEHNAALNQVEAKKLLKQYIYENPDDPAASFVGVFEVIKECMEEDGFFKLTGLDQVMKNMTEGPQAEPKKEPSKSGKKVTRIQK